MSTTSDVRSGQNRKTVANKLAIIYLNIRNKQKRQLDALKAQAQNRFPQHIRKTIEAETQTRSFMWAPSPVSLSAKTSFFPRWLAGCLAHSDKDPQIKRKTPEKGIIANNLFHFDGLDQQIVEGT